MALATINMASAYNQNNVHTWTFSRDNNEERESIQKMLKSLMSVRKCCFKNTEDTQFQTSCLKSCAGIVLIVCGSHIYYMWMLFYYLHAGIVLLCAVRVIARIMTIRYYLREDHMVIWINN
jgi:hypothetical protein